MNTTLNALVNYDANNYKLINLFLFKRGEKLNKKQFEAKKEEIEHLLIKVGSKEIMREIMEENTAIETEPNELIEYAADDTETELNKTNKLLKWVHEAADENTVSEVTRYLVTLATEAQQLECISGNPLIQTLN